MTKTLPALKAYQGTHHRHDVLVISKPVEGLKGGEVGLFFDQEIGLELLRRANAYTKLVEALRECHAHLGWRPAKIPAHVADEAMALLRQLREAA